MNLVASSVLLRICKKKKGLNGIYAVGIFKVYYYDTMRIGLNFVHILALYTACPRKVGLKYTIKYYCAIYKSVLNKGFLFTYLITSCHIAYLSSAKTE